MGIWVRSQSGGMLLNISGFSVGTSSTDSCIFGRVETSDCLGMIIGSYPTETEATEVLDMIQERIDMTRPESIMAQGKVFRVPAAGFSFVAKEAD